LLTKANARMNILSITAGCSEYRLSVTHNAYESVTTLPIPPSGVGRGRIWIFDSQENH